MLSLCLAVINTCQGSSILSPDVAPSQRSGHRFSSLPRRTFLDAYNLFVAVHRGDKVSHGVVGGFSGVGSAGIAIDIEWPREQPRVAFVEGIPKCDNVENDEDVEEDAADAVCAVSFFERAGHGDF